MDQQNLCQICTTIEFKYTCPKCNRLYCSLACYRDEKHKQCSEAFYRDCVTEELAARSADRSHPKSLDEAKRMYEILKRVNENLENEDLDDNERKEEAEELSGDGVDSDDEDIDGEDLAVRLDGVNLDDPDAVWSCLSPSERHEFESLLKTGDIHKIIPLLYVWWDHKMQKKLIEEISAQTTEIGAETLDHPKLLDNIPQLNTIMKKPPSPCLPNNLYNILSSYVCTVRFFNNDHHVCPVDASKYLIYNSAALNKNANFDDNEQAVKSILLECRNGDSIPPWKEIAIDVKKILQGPYEDRCDSIYVKAALSDIYRLLEEAKCVIAKGVESDQSMNGSEKLDRKKLTNVMKKIEFFLSFVYANKLF